MPRVVKSFFLILLLLFAAIQLYRPERTNPPIDPSLRLENHVTVSPEVKAIFDRSCKDCHSFETRWPWYSNVAPASWLLARDVHSARDEMNLSEWGDYDLETMDEQLEKMCEEVRERHMPLPAYTWLHRDARLTDAERETLCAWTERERKALSQKAQDEP